MGVAKGVFQRSFAQCGKKIGGCPMPMGIAGKTLRLPPIRRFHTHRMLRLVFVGPAMPHVFTRSRLVIAVQQRVRPGNEETALVRGEKREGRISVKHERPKGFRFDADRGTRRFKTGMEHALAERRLEKTSIHVAIDWAGSRPWARSASASESGTLRTARVTSAVSLQKSQSTSGTTTRESLFTSRNR